MTENEKILLAALETAMGALTDWNAPEKTRQTVMSGAWSKAQKAISDVKRSSGVKINDAPKKTPLLRETKE